MQLLSPKSNQDKKNEQDVRDILRIQELREAENKARKDLANSQAEFSLTLAKNNQQWAEEEQAHEKRLAERKQEIDQLEAKRLNLLIPIDIIKQSAEEKLANAEAYMKNLREREEYAEELAETLQDRLDEIGQKEQSVLRREQEVAVKEDDVKQMRQSQVVNTEALNRQLAEFLELRDKDEQERKAKHKALSLWEQSLNEQDAETREMKKQNDAAFVRLADERGVLARAWKELERKKSA